MSLLSNFGIYTKVPLNIFQCYNKKILDDDINFNIKTINDYNPEFNYFLFDEITDCKKFIFDNYPDYVYSAYNQLIPIEYKNDLWKYCILYKYGGIYIDIKFNCNYKLINFINNNFFASQFDYYNNKYLIYSGFIITKPKNPIFLRAINTIISNIKNNYYGISETYPTGSGLLGSIFSNNRLKSNLIYDGSNILYKNHIIMRSYNNMPKKEYYKLLWLTKNIYKCQKTLTFINQTNLKPPSPIRFHE
jgi:mannosyltransferase OCH1-like enzyme